MRDCRARGPVRPAGEQPKDFVVIARGAETERFVRDDWAVECVLAATETFEAEIGPAHRRRI